MNTAQTIKTTTRTRRLVKVGAAAAVLSLAAGSAAQAVTARKIIAQGDINASAEGSVAFDGSLASTSLSGRVEGVMHWNGGLAGCAKVRAEWMDANGTVLQSRADKVCSDSSLPAFEGFLFTFPSSTTMRKVRVTLLKKVGVNGSFQTVQAKTYDTAGTAIPF